MFICYSIFGVCFGGPLFDSFALFCLVVISLAMNVSLAGFSMACSFSVCNIIYLLYCRIVLTVNFNVNAWLQASAIDFRVNLS